MIVAKKNGRFVYANASLQRDKYECPICHEPVYLKKGKINAIHFAHYGNSLCVNSEGETAEHIRGKMQLFDWADTKGYKPKLETYIPAIRQRPDIMLAVNGAKVAIEFQCSPLSLERIVERNAGYRQQNIQVWWILGSPYLKKSLSRKKIAQFTLYYHGQVHLLYWNVYDEEFNHFEPQKIDYLSLNSDCANGKTSD